MSIKLSDTYPGRAAPPSADYPLGAFKNCSAPEVLDGTPLDKDWANDKEGFFQGILAEAGITADGQPDKVGASQYLEALKSVISQEVPFATQSEYDAHTSNDKVVSPFVMQPSLEGSAVLTGSNNVVAMSEIVTALGLEKGDVIQIKIASPAYDKLHTVESIANDGSIVVNYEHCGGRGNGSLKLPDYTGAVTVKRVAKWFNAAEGLGQDWVNLNSFRSNSTNFINQTGRSIGIAYSSGNVSNMGVSALVNGATVFSVTVGGGGGSGGQPTGGTVALDATSGSTYRINASLAFAAWAERR